MTREPEHARSAEALGAYVLAALPADEAADVEAHVATCQRCRDDLSELRAAADLLAASAPPVVPPPALKQRIMAVVEAEAEVLRAAGPEADRPPAARRRRLGHLFPRPAVTAAAAAAALAAGVAGGIVLVDGQDRQPSTRVLSAKLTDPRVARSARASVHLSGDEARLVVQGLPDPPPRRVYQVWFKPADAPPVPSGTTFAVRSGTVELRRGLRRGEAVLVTHEPAGGSPAPTRPPLIVATPA